MAAGAAQPQTAQTLAAALHELTSDKTRLSQANEIISSKDRFSTLLANAIQQEFLACWETVIDAKFIAELQKLKSDYSSMTNLAQSIDKVIDATGKITGQALNTAAAASSAAAAIVPPVALMPAVAAFAKVAIPSVTDIVTSLSDIIFEIIGLAQAAKIKEERITALLEQHRIVKMLQLLTDEYPEARNCKIEFRQSVDRTTTPTIKSIITRFAKDVADKIGWRHAFLIHALVNPQDVKNKLIPFFSYVISNRIFDAECLGGTAVERALIAAHPYDDEKIFGKWADGIRPGIRNRHPVEDDKMQQIVGKTINLKPSNFPTPGWTPLQFHLVDLLNRSAAIVVDEQGLKINDLRASQFESFSDKKGSYYYPVQPADKNQMPPIILQQGENFDDERIKALYYPNTSRDSIAPTTQQYHTDVAVLMLQKSTQLWHAHCTYMDHTFTGSQQESADQANRELTEHRTMAHNGEKKGRIGLIKTEGGKSTFWQASCSDKSHDFISQRGLSDKDASDALEKHKKECPHAGDYAEDNGRISPEPGH